MQFFKDSQNTLKGIPRVLLVLFGCICIYLYLKSVIELNETISTIVPVAALGLLSTQVSKLIVKLWYKIRGYDTHDGRFPNSVKKIKLIYLNVYFNMIFWTVIIALVLISAYSFSESLFTSLIAFVESLIDSLQNNRILLWILLWPLAIARYLQYFYGRTIFLYFPLVLYWGFLLGLVTSVITIPFTYKRSFGK